MKTTIEIDDELFRAAKFRAVETRRSLRDVVESALRMFLDGGGSGAGHPGADAAGRKARLTEIIGEIDALPVLDDRSPDEILGYNTQGTFD